MFLRMMILKMTTLIQDLKSLQLLSLLPKSILSFKGFVSSSFYLNVLNRCSVQSYSQVHCLLIKTHLRKGFGRLRVKLRSFILISRYVFQTCLSTGFKACGEKNHVSSFLLHIWNKTTVSVHESHVSSRLPTTPPLLFFSNANFFFSSLFHLEGRLRN